MPIYEFYCPACHVVFSFLARTVNTRRRPDCPRCGRRRIERRPSSFAIGSAGAAGPGGGDADAEAPAGSAGFDEARLERAMDELARQADGLDEDDAPAMAGMMRKLYDGMGLPLGPAMAEAIRRIERGDDPDRVEDDLGDALEQEDPAAEPGSALGRLRRRMLAPRVDPTLHEL
jgi:putative FmdB family regulatory protein